MLYLIQTIIWDAKQRSSKGMILSKLHSIWGISWSSVDWGII